MPLKFISYSKARSKNFEFPIDPTCLSEESFEWNMKEEHEDKNINIEHLSKCAN